MSEKMYKVLGKGRKAIHGGKYTYPTGRWTKRIADPLLCENGYHVCKRDDVLEWLTGEDAMLPFEIWEVECEGLTYHDYERKGVSERVRLIRRIATLDEFDLRWLGTLFAATVLDNTTDKRVSDCLLTVQDYCLGEATADDLSAARYAARSAAYSAAWSAAESAAQSAARYAARYAARSAAYSAAWSAAESAARSRNADILFDYIGE